MSTIKTLSLKKGGWLVVQERPDGTFWINQNLRGWIPLDKKGEIPDMKFIDAVALANGGWALFVEGSDGLIWVNRELKGWYPLDKDKREIPFRPLPDVI